MMGRRLKGRAAVGIGGLGIAGMVALGGAAVVFACTTIMARMTISPTSGPPGTVVSTSVAGALKANATYAIQLGQSVGTYVSGTGRFDGTYGKDCMDTTGVANLGSVTTNASGGGWSSVNVTIPAGTSIGPHEICGLETSPKAGQTGTTHETFTVIGL